MSLEERYPIQLTTITIKIKIKANDIIDMVFELSDGKILEINCDTSSEKCHPPQIPATKAMNEASWRTSPLLMPTNIAGIKHIRIAISTQLKEYSIAIFFQKQ